MRNDALIKPISVVVGVQLRRRLAAVLDHASADLAAVADRGPVVPVEGFTHAEVWREVVVNTELDVTSIEDPRLVTRWITGYVIEDPYAIWVHHKGRYPRGD